jgi:hypothetical protein
MLASIVKLCPDGRGITGVTMTVNSLGVAGQPAKSVNLTEKSRQNAKQHLQRIDAELARRKRGGR